MRESLKAVIADYLAVEPSTLSEGFRFSGDRFQGSVGMYKFAAFAQKRLGKRVPAIPYGAGLEEALALLGDPTAAPGESRVPAPGAAPRSSAATVAPAWSTQAGSAELGVDIESVSAMPPAADFRSHEFYASAFTPEEIAYCVLKGEPRIHFCGLFSAKEALKKSSPAFLDLHPGEIEIGHDRAGRPFFRRAGEVRDPAFSLSISHTSEHAVAVAIAVTPMAFASAPAAAPTDPAAEEARARLGDLENSVRKMRVWNALLAGALALAAATGLVILLLARP